jgi:hypothetical protein
MTLGQLHEHLHVKVFVDQWEFSCNLTTPDCCYSAFHIKFIIVNLEKSMDSCILIFGAWEIAMIYKMFFLDTLRLLFTLDTKLLPDTRVSFTYFLSDSHLLQNQYSHSDLSTNIISDPDIRIMTEKNAGTWHITYVLLIFNWEGSSSYCVKVGDGYYKKYEVVCHSSMWVGCTFLIKDDTWKSLGDPEIG